MTAATLVAGLRATRVTGLGAPILVVLMLGMIVLPLPPFALDLLFTFNISLSLVVLLAVIYSGRPLDFPVFPTVLLVTTLMRLALNVASTRVVLLEGHTGTDAAGRVIEAFGAFVLGGSFAVGIVVFAVLVIINFVVVTKGASRISEVSARFTLDGMPGKQMAVDADLNSGLIDPDAARLRRAEIAAEADFYGAMDGAGKFVRGDATAGMLILAVNLIGGLAIGTLQHGLPFTTALHQYSLLTIGDGLVAQIPSLLLSSGAAVMVTRVSTRQDMGQQVMSQLFTSPQPLAVTAGAIGLMGLVPGMPNVAFLLLAGIAGAGAHLIHRRRQQPAPEPEAVEPEVTAGPSELTWDEVGVVDPIGLDVGYRLIPLVDSQHNGPLMSKIRGIRKKLSQDLGFLVPPVHIRDDLDLEPHAYRISMMGVTVVESQVRPDLELAINPGEVFGELQGLSVKDPVFGLPAVWIDPSERHVAQTHGYTVVDPSTVIATHLNQIVQGNAHDLLGHEETQKLLDRLRETCPKLVDELVPKVLPLGVLVKTLQSLLRERIPIRHIRTIVEALAECAARTQDPERLTAAARVALGRFIVQDINGLREELPVIALDPAIDRLLRKALGSSEHGPALEPGLAEKLNESLAAAAEQRNAEGDTPVLLVADDLRPYFSMLARHAAPQLRVLAFGEVPDTTSIRLASTVRIGADPARGLEGAR